MALKKKKDIQSKWSYPVETKSKFRENSDDKSLRKLREVVDLNQFQLESEFEEEGLKIKLPKRFGPKDKVTKISVVKDGGVVEEVDVSELEDILSAKPDIKKIVIEQVKLKGAERVSLIYDKDETVDSDLSKKMLEHKAKRILEEQRGSTNLAIVERKLNSDFYETNKAATTHNRNERPVVDATGPSTDSSNDNNRDIADILERQFSDPYGGKGGLRDSIVSDESEEGADAVYQQQVLIRKSESVKNNFYYKTKNHVDLFNIGQSFLADFESGLKSFGLIGENRNQEREKTVFGIAAFFNYHSEIQATIVTESIQESFYYRYIGNLRTETGHILDEELSYTYYISEGMAFIEINELERIQQKLRKFSFEEFVSELKAVSDIILWDLPELDVIRKNKILYFPILRMLDNVSLVVTENSSRYKGIHKIINYFDKYSVPVKGFLVNSMRKEGGE